MNGGLKNMLEMCLHNLARLGIMSRFRGVASRVAALKTPFDLHYARALLIYDLGSKQTNIQI